MSPPIKEDTPDQLTALVTADTLEKGGPGVWPFIDPKDLADSLRERIRAPTKIKQSTTPHCGPAAIAFDLASNNPRLYAEIIAGLYRNGYAYVPGLGFDGNRLTASNRLRNEDYNLIYGVRSPDNQPAADWILLSSIRNSESWGKIYWGEGWPFGWGSGTTLPSTFERWLLGLGYTRTVNKTNLVVTKDVLDLQEASSLFDRGWRVFLFVNSKCLEKPTQTDRSLTANHYTALMSTVTLTPVVNTGGFLTMQAMSSDHFVSFTCATWGRSQRVPEDPNIRLTGKDFCKNFYGYVAAIN